MSLQKKCFEVIFKDLFFQQNKNNIYNTEDLNHLIEITDVETMIENIITNENFKVPKIQKRIEEFKLKEFDIIQDYNIELFRFLFDLFILMFLINVNNINLGDDFFINIEKFFCSNYKENEKYISMFFEASMKCKKNNFWLSGEDFNLDLIRHKFFVESIEYYLNKFNNSNFEFERLIFSKLYNKSTITINLYFKNVNFLRYYSYENDKNEFLNNIHCIFNSLSYGDVMFSYDKDGYFVGKNISFIQRPKSVKTEFFYVDFMYKLDHGYNYNKYVEKLKNKHNYIKNIGKKIQNEDWYTTLSKKYNFMSNIIQFTKFNTYYNEYIIMKTTFVFKKKDLNLQHEIEDIINKTLNCLLYE